MRMYTEQEVSKLIHDVRNPLTSIMNFSEILLEEGLTNKETRELLHIIHEESKKIEEILKNFRKNKTDPEKNREILPYEKDISSTFKKGAKAKILVVDDDGSIRRIIRLDLEKSGYEVYTVYNGREALELLNKVEPDLIISDITMPEMSGFELYERLSKENRIIPFIFLTAYDSPEKKIKSLKLGVDAYLTKPFSKEELLARIDSLLSKSKKIFNNIFIDGLTHVFNRRFIDEELPYKISQSMEQFEPISVAMCDIDLFKHVNDTYGHQAGDMVLRFLGKFLKSQLRGDDIVARYGGEEFLIVLENTPKEKAYKVLERIRDNLSHQEVSIGDGKKIKITVSIGLSSFPEDGNNLEELIKVADKALYRAKQTGRNKVAIIKSLKRRS